MRNYDIDVPASTVRAWVIGLLLTTIGSGLNALFSLRNPSISISSYVAQLVAYPLGKGWEYVMPKRKFKTFGREWSLNPGQSLGCPLHAIINANNSSLGPFNMKVGLTS